MKTVTELEIRPYKPGWLRGTRYRLFCGGQDEDCIFSSCLSYRWEVEIGDYLTYDEAHRVRNFLFDYLIPPKVSLSPDPKNTRGRKRKPNKHKRGKSL